MKNISLNWEHLIQWRHRHRRWTIMCRHTSQYRCYWCLDLPPWFTDINDYYNDSLHLCRHITHVLFSRGCATRQSLSWFFPPSEMETFQNETVSSGDTVVVSTHTFMTQSPPWKVPILGEWYILCELRSKVHKSSIRSSNLGRWAVVGCYSVLVQHKIPYSVGFWQQMNSSLLQALHR